MVDIDGDADRAGGVRAARSRDGRGVGVAARAGDAGEESTRVGESVCNGAGEEKARARADGSDRACGADGAQPTASSRNAISPIRSSRAAPAATASETGDRRPVSVIPPPFAAADARVPARLLRDPLDGGYIGDIRTT